MFLHVRYSDDNWLILHKPAENMIAIPRNPVEYPPLRVTSETFVYSDTYAIEYLASRHYAVC